MEDPSQTTSWGLRLNMWRNAWIIFSQSPWFGVGPGDYEQAAKALVTSGGSYSTDPILYEQAHNTYIHTMAESGLFTMLAFAVGAQLLPLLAFLRHWRASQDHGFSFEVLGGAIVVLAFAIYGIGHAWMGSNNFVSVYLIFLLVFLYSLANRAASART
jgi:O-antigen ligase